MSEHDPPPAILAVAMTIIGAVLVAAIIVEAML
jgi:hypothetical protein